MKGVSEKLKAAMEEISKVTKAYDINACVFLADGEKNGEFKIFHDKPTWSQLEFNTLKDGSTAVRVKVRMKTKPENTNKTVNSIYNLQGMMTEVWLMNDSIIKTMKKEMDIEDDPGKVISQEEYLKNKNKN